MHVVSVPVLLLTIAVRIRTLSAH